MFSKTKTVNYLFTKLSLISVLPILLLVLDSCDEVSTNNIKYYAEYLLENDGYLLWTDSTKINVHGIKTKSNNGKFRLTNKFILFWKSNDQFSFELINAFDKNDSYVDFDYAPYDSLYKILFVELANIKFDFFEYEARKFRKYLLEENFKTEREFIEGMVNERITSANQEWKEIQNKIFDNYDTKTMKFYGSNIKLKLDSLQKYDSKVNFQFDM
ncbi:MAG: hypothetical protein OEW75_01885 [Cyclobacteriaceae bacterium]|nr:hypothetical protein [Cyclobacteriaceae bacterium]